MTNVVNLKELEKNLSLEERLKLVQGKVYIHKDFEDEEYKYLWYFYNAHIEEGNSQWIGFDTIDLFHRAGERFIYRCLFIDYGSPMDLPLIEASLPEFDRIKDIYFNQIAPLSAELRVLIEFFGKIHDEFNRYRCGWVDMSRKEFFLNRNSMSLDSHSIDIEKYFNKWFFDIEYNSFVKPIGLTDNKEIIINCLTPEFRDTTLSGFGYIVPMEIYPTMDGLILLTEENSKRVEEISNKFLDIVKPLFE